MSLVLTFLPAVLEVLTVLIFDTGSMTALNRMLYAYPASILMIWTLSCRRRSFALFFAGGEDENVVRHHVGDCRPWPPQYRGKKATCGLAGAAIVSLGKDKQEVSKISSSTRSAILTNIEASLTGKSQL